VEIADTSHKDNYNKVVIQKRKCVPCTAETVITLTEDVGDDVGARLKYVLNNNNKIIRPNVPPKPKTRPKVPPKPSQFTKREENVPTVPPAPGPHVVSNNPNIVNQTNSSDPGNRSNSIPNGHLTERLINETKSFIEKNLIKERKELLERMQKNVNFLKEDQTEILNELSENSQQIRKILEQIRVEGSIIDADKLKLHIDELESVTSLLTVLKVRLKAAENKLEVTKDSKDKEYLNNKIIKLSSQVQEAEQLKSFRNRRGDKIMTTVGSYLNHAVLNNLNRLIVQLVNLRTEMSEVEEKLHLAVRQIHALKF